MRETARVGIAIILIAILLIFPAKSQQREKYNTTREAIVVLYEDYKIYCSQTKHKEYSPLCGGNILVSETPSFDGFMKYLKINME